MLVKGNLSSVDIELDQILFSYISERRSMLR